MREGVPDVGKEKNKGSKPPDKKEGNRRVDGRTSGCHPIEVGNKGGGGGEEIARIRQREDIHRVLKRLSGGRREEETFNRQREKLAKELRDPMLGTMRLKTETVKKIFVKYRRERKIGPGLPEGKNRKSRES